MGTFCACYCLYWEHYDRCIMSGGILTWGYNAGRHYVLDSLTLTLKLNRASNHSYSTKLISTRSSFNILCYYVMWIKFFPIMGYGAYLHLRLDTTWSTIDVLLISTIIMHVYCKHMCHTLWALIVQLESFCNLKCLRILKIKNLVTVAKD